MSSKRIPAFLAYFVMMFVITFALSAWMVLIWWAAQFGYWWSAAAMAFGVAIVSAVLLTFKDPAKVRQ